MNLFRDVPDILEFPWLMGGADNSKLLFSLPILFAPDEL
jgi:hypothetical protein